MAVFDLNILGCGSALPTYQRQTSSQVVDLRDKLYMVDCGEGAQLQMRKKNIKMHRINHIFISHLHGDHCFGLPGLLSSLGMLGRLGDLVIYGPPEVGEYVRYIDKMFCQGSPFKIVFNPVDPNVHALIMEDRSVSVYTIPMKHRIPCCGYLFEEKARSPHIIKEMTDFYNVPVREMSRIKQGEDFVTADGQIIPNNVLTKPAEPAKRYAYCSDTAYFPKITPFIEGVDLLYHEATFSESEHSRAYDTFHSTAEQAAIIARDANVRQLVIGHFSARYNDLSILKNEACRIFPNTLLASDGMTISV